MSIFQRYISLLLIAVFAGCGGSDLELAEVEGVVSLDGKPLPNAVVTFSPQDGGPNAIGKTNAEGEYQLMTSAQLGAVSGTHSVSIICVPDPEPVKDAGSSHAAPGGRTASASYRAPSVPKVPPRYNAQTELTEEIEAGTTNTVNFDLES